MQSETSAAVTLLFTDIEGSTQLWEREPARMPAALARHDRLLRDAVESHAGVVVKTTGDGLYAAFDDPVRALGAALDMQLKLALPAEDGLDLQVRIGLHSGIVERRDHDYFGTAVNRAARIMGSAHGGQVLVSQVLADAVGDRLPDGVSLRSLGRVRLRGLARVEGLWQVVHPALRGDFPPLRSLETTPNNLPEQLSSFIGRQRDREDIASLLGTARLVTLVGAGGLGKTRLALQVAADLLDRYADGAWLVELAPLADPAAVPQAVANVLGVRGMPDRPLTEALVSFMADRHLLLLLDNCEHVVKACADLAETLLRSGPRLTILASSREPLRVSAEHTYPVPALEVPDAASAHDPEAAVRFEAIRLFVDRALAVHPGFSLTPRALPAVLAICRRLDGIPLAIELAAARLRTLPVDTIAARLEDRFRLLTSASRTAEPRQQTLRALIGWSHDLLGAQERALFSRLAVFAGGWTLEAAESVAAGDGLDRIDILELLTGLVEKSLVVFEPATGRYRLLETVRHYAMERLEASPDSAPARSRHAGFYLELARRAARKLNQGSDSGEWLDALDAEQDNLLATHEFFCRSPVEESLVLVDATYGYWLRRGRLQTGIRLAEQALAAAGAQQPTVARCLALHAAGLLNCFAGRYAEAQQLLEESQSIADAIGVGYRMAARLQLLALALLGQGDWAAARAHCLQAVEMAERGNDTLQLASALCNLAQTYRLAGEFDEADRLIERSSALGVTLGNRDLVAMNSVALAMIALGRGSVTAAVARTRDAAAMAIELKSHTTGQAVIDASVALAVACEAWNDAGRFFGASEMHLAGTGLRRDPVDDAMLAPLLARARQSAAEPFAAGEIDGRRLSYGDAIIRVQAWLDRQPPM